MHNPDFKIDIGSDGTKLPSQTWKKLGTKIDIRSIGTKLPSQYQNNAYANYLKIDLASDGCQLPSNKDSDLKELSKSF